jgi:hypothetical protein
VLTVQYAILEEDIASIVWVTRQADPRELDSVTVKVEEYNPPAMSKYSTTTSCGKPKRPAKEEKLTLAPLAKIP